MPTMKKDAQKIYDMAIADAEQMRAAADTLSEKIILKITDGITDKELRDLIARRASLEAAAARLTEMANKIYGDQRNWE